MVNFSSEEVEQFNKLQFLINENYEHQQLIKDVCQEVNTGLHIGDNSPRDISIYDFDLRTFIDKTEQSVYNFIMRRGNDMFNVVDIDEILPNYEQQERSKEVWDVNTLVNRINQVGNQERKHFIAQVCKAVQHCLPKIKNPDKENCDYWFKNAWLPEHIHRINSGKGFELEGSVRPGYPLKQNNVAKVIAFINFAVNQIRYDLIELERIDIEHPYKAYPFKSVKMYKNSKIKFVCHDKGTCDEIVNLLLMTDKPEQISEETWGTFKHV